MQVTEHIHALKIPFKLEIRPGKTLDRFVYAYLIYGKKICLIDCGVSSAEKVIFDYLKKTDRDPKEISTIVFTHAHGDHIGGALGVKKATGCDVAAHADDVPWIQDTERQYRERPISNFHSLVGGSMDVEIVLKGGETLDLGNGTSLKVIHTPGHSKGSIAIVYGEDGALFSGDGIPLKGAVPIYEDVLSSIKSIKKLKDIKGLKVLFASWDEPQRGERVYELMDEGLRYLQHIHDLVLKEKSSSPSTSVKEISTRVLSTLGFPDAAQIPMVVKSIEGHLKAADRRDLLAA